MTIQPTTVTLSKSKGQLKFPLKIAILLNSYRSPFISEIRDSYIRSIGAVSPDSVLTFFLPAENPEDFPDPEKFDLIVLGGGNADPRKKHAWILRVHKFVLDLVRNHPGKKLLALCWGHQTVSLLFGGEVGDMDVPELGVTESKLTQAGHHFFSGMAGPLKRPGANAGSGHHETGVGGGVGGGGIIRLQQHHRRVVETPPKGFYELLAGNQAFLSHNNSILTFQGHPEKDARCAKLRIGDATRWFGVDMGDHVALGRIQRDMERQHDGPEVWGRVFDWVREKGPSTVTEVGHGGGMHL